MNKQNFLFEVATEICYKVGGIYTIMRSKLEQTIKHFGNDYILIGPWRGKTQNKEFIEHPFPILEKAKKILAKNGISCHTGYWNTETKPKVILVKFKRRHKIRDLLDHLKTNFGVDSSDANFDYIKAAFFAATAGETIEILTKNNLVKNKNIIAHFHEWMCGAGLLHLKKNCKNVATIFTTHATVFGRAIAYDNMLVQDLPENIDIDLEAHKHKQMIFAKHSLEKATTKNADYFTAVSSLVANESKRVLKRYPDKIIQNGLNIKQRLEMIDFSKIQNTRKKLLKIASKVTKQKIDSNALIWISSGRYEFHNKGYDLILKSLAKLRDELPKNSPPIIMFFLVAFGTHPNKKSLINADAAKYPNQKNAIGLATHTITNPKKDEIIKMANKLDFKKSKKVHIVFSNTYIEKEDKIYNLNYEEILAACDLSLFPSFYEPWGYTPLESLAYHVPTITSDLAGFGLWVQSKVGSSDAAFVLNRKGNSMRKSANNLKNYLKKIIENCSDEKYINEIREKSFQIAKLADWKSFYQGYLEAYEEASTNQNKIK